MLLQMALKKTCYLQLSIAAVQKYYRFFVFDLDFCNQNLVVLVGFLQTPQDFLLACSFVNKTVLLLPSQFSLPQCTDSGLQKNVKQTWWEQTSLSCFRIWESVFTIKYDVTFRFCLFVFLCILTVLWHLVEPGCGLEHGHCKYSSGAWKEKCLEQLCS